MRNAPIRTGPRTLPGGGKAWFVRMRRGAKYKINPCSIEGWLVVGAFTVVTMLSVLLLLPEPTPMRFAVWGTVQAAAVILLVVVSLRMSAPLPKD